MQTKFGHAQFNIDQTNLPFYRELFAFLGWTPMADDASMLGVGDANGASVWFMPQTKSQANDYDGPGMNHLAISAEAQSDVDATVSYLQGHNIPALFETPRHRPDFGMGEGQTYYQVMFETPDRLLMEVVYIGPKSA